MAQLQASSATVEEWRRKSFECYSRTNEGYHSLVTKGFDSMVLLLAQSSDRNQVLRALLTLDYERKIAMQFENSNATSDRMMTYGLIESFHLTFLHLFDKIVALQAQVDRFIPKSTVEQCMQTDEISLEPVVVKSEESSNEIMEHPMHIENGNEIAQYPRLIANSLDNLSTVPDFTQPLQKETKDGSVITREEPINTTQTVGDHNQGFDLDNFGDDFNGDEMLDDDVIIIDDDLIEEERGEKTTGRDTMTGGRSSRNGSKVKNYADLMDDVESDSVPATKKARADSEKETKKKKIVGKERDDSREDALIEEEREENITGHDAMKDSTETVEVEKRRRLSKSKNYGQFLDNSDSDSEPAAKISRSDSEKKKKDKKRSSCKKGDQSASNGYMNDTGLECPECETVMADRTLHKSEATI